MHVNQLSHFIEVSRSGSFTKAAARLKLTQPALSKSIRLLEQELGTDLLARNKLGIKPTEVGKILFAEADRILRDIDGLKGRLSVQDALQIGRFTLGASDNISNHLLPKLWSGFGMKFPNLELVVFSGTSDAIQNELLSRRIEIGISYHESVNPKIRCERLAEVEFVIVSSHRLKIRDLNGVPFIGSISEDYRAPYAAMKILREFGIRPREAIQCNQQEVQMNMAMEGLGYTVIPKFMASRALQSGDLKMVAVPKRPRVPLFYSYFDRSKLSGIGEAFREHLRGMLPALV